MNKLHFYLFALCISFGITLQGMTQAHTATIPVQQRKVLVFDFHDVILKGQYSIAYKAFLTHLHWIRYNSRLISRLVLFGINKKIKTFDPKKLSVEYAVLQETTDEAYQQYALTILNPHVINTQTTQYITSLGDSGFLRFGFSNIGVDSFNHLHGTETIDPLFDGKYICNGA